MRVSCSALFPTGLHFMPNATGTSVSKFHSETAALTFFPVLRALKPGGWIDCSEPSIYLDSYHTKLPEDHCYKQWGKTMLEAGNKSGLSFEIGPYLKDRLVDAGFVNVVERKVCCTIGRWSNDPWEREVGAWEQLRLYSGIPDFCSRRFVNNLGVRID
jgi:hypothetical protein